MLSIRLDSIESTRIVSPAVDLLYRKSICASFWNYSFPGLYRVGWKCCRIDTNRFPCCRFVIPEVDRLRESLKLQRPGSIQGGLKMLSIRFDSNESTRIVSLAVDLLHRKSICEIFRKYSFPSLYRVGWKCCPESLVSPAVDLLYRKSICASEITASRVYTGWVENVVDSIRYSIRSNRHESFPLLSICYTGSRFARVFEITASRVYTGWVENVVESTRIVSPAVDSLYRKSICASLWNYSVPGLYRVGWKCCRFDSIRTNRHESFPLLSICYTGSRFARYLENIASRVSTGWVENVVDSTRFDRIDTNRFPCCRFVIPEVDLREFLKLQRPGSIQGGLKMLSNRHESFPLLSICYTGSRFARYLENIASRVSTGWVENVVDSTRFDRIDTNRFPCCRFVIPEVDLREFLKLQPPGSIQGGLKMLSNRHESFPLLSIRYTGSRFARVFEITASRVYTGWVENVVDSIRFERIDTNRFPCCRFVTPEVDLRDI